MPDKDTILDKVTQFADRSHGMQLRRYSEDRYIVHPVRVMETCKEYTDDITILAAALLHDVLEDTPIRKEQIKSFLNRLMTEEQAVKTLTLVVELTDVYIKADFPKLNRKKRKAMEAARLENTSADAQTIKYADMIDNAPEITEKDPAFAKRFLKEYRYLLRKITKGNPELYNRAMDTLNTCIAASENPSR